MMSRCVALALSGLAALSSSAFELEPQGQDTGSKEVSFTRDVAPILVQRCFACHGGAKRKGRYSLDTYERMLAAGAMELPPVVPGDLAQSYLFELVVAPDDFDRMPQDGDPLPPEEIATLRAWIESGASFDGEDVTASLTSFASADSAPAPPETYLHPQPVRAALFSASGRALVSAGYRELLVFDSASGVLARRLPGLPPTISALARHPRHDLIAVAGGDPGEIGGLWTIDLATGTVDPSWTSFGDVALAVAFDPTGELLAVAGADRSVRVFDAETRALRWESALHSDWICDLSFDHDGRFLVTGGRDHSAKVFEARTGTLFSNYTRHTQTLPDREMYSHAIYAVAGDALSPLVVTAGEGSDVHLWSPEGYKAEDGTAAQMETRFQSKSSVRVVFGDPSDTLALALGNGFVYVGSESGDLRAFALEAPSDDAAVTEAVTATETADGVAPELPDFEGAIFSLTLSPDHATLACGLATGELVLLDAVTGRERLRIEARP